MKKLTFNSISTVLSRAEMKQIMAGSGGQQCNCLYCYGEHSFDTFPVIGECDFNPLAECLNHGFYFHANFGLC